MTIRPTFKWPPKPEPMTVTGLPDSRGTTWGGRRAVPRRPNKAAVLRRAIALAHVEGVQSANIVIDAAAKALREGKSREGIQRIISMSLFEASAKGQAVVDTQGPNAPAAIVFRTWARAFNATAEARKADLR